jgi:hypothetical protein
MEGHQQHLRRGFNWLGGATIVAKITDVATILLVLRFLSKEQVGAASVRSSRRSTGWARAQRSCRPPRCRACNSIPCFG